jgi:hypothetical protein
MTRNESRPGDGARGAAMVERLAGLDCDVTATRDETKGWPRVIALCGDLGDLLADMPLSRARAVVRALAAAVDDARAAMGLDTGLLDAVPAYVPDFLKTPADHKRDLWLAWRALGEADRARFLDWASRGRRAAA